MLILITLICAKRSGLVYVSSTGSLRKATACTAPSVVIRDVILLQFPQQKFESYHRSEINNHNLSLRLELLCFTHN